MLAYLKSCETSIMVLFCENRQRLLTVNYFRKNSMIEVFKFTFLNMLKLKWYEWWSAGIIANSKHTNLVILLLLKLEKIFRKVNWTTFHYMLDARKFLKEGGCLWRRVVTLPEEPKNLVLVIRVWPFISSTVFSGFPQCFFLIFCMKLVFSQHLTWRERDLEKNSHCT